jgi:drug/metabolite transporter (DMT)-like permease
MFNPMAFDWQDQRALIGNGVILLASFCWAANILYVRAHKWVSTPFQLVFWQALLATCILTGLALRFDGIPNINWNSELAYAFLFTGVCGTALAYWAMAVVNRHLPAVTTSLGLLATPVVGIASSAIGLGETLSASLMMSVAVILGGIVLGTSFPRRCAT